MELFIRKYKPIEDTNTIDSWEKTFQGKKEYEELKNYIVENNNNYSISDIINYFNKFSTLPFCDEKLFTYSIINEDKNLVGVCIFDYCDYNGDGDLIIKYFFVNPGMQNSHFGSTILKSILLNSQKYLKKEPKEVSMLIDRNNIPCLKMASNLGFDFYESTEYENYFIAKARLSKIKEKCTYKKMEQ